jgi:hypothetical protein
MLSIAEFHSRVTVSREAGDVFDALRLLNSVDPARVRNADDDSIGWDPWN